MRDIDYLFSKVRPYAANCPEPLMAAHLRKAAIILCQRTRCWRERDTFQTTGDEVEILALPPQASLFEIEEARFNDMLLERSRPRGEIAMYGEGQPQYITQLAHNTVSLQPRGVGTLWLSMFLRPSQNADMLPDILMDEFADALGHGALSTLLLIQNEPFSNPQLGMFYAQQFTDVLDRNFAYNVRGQQRAAKRSKARFL